MGCPHVATAHLSPPNAFTQVHKEECTQCFDSQDSENGIDVCLTCFNAGCNDPTRHHAQTHFLKTQHPLVLNIQRVTLDKPKRADDDTPPPQKISKLAIVPENEEEKYEHWTKVKCYACDGVEVERTTGNLPTIIDSVLASLTYTKQSEIKAWEQEIVPCDHTRHLQQSPPHKLESQSHCTRCDLTQNLWLCLVCGNLGCGRKQFGSDVGGNGHGLQHFEETRHAVSCKLGTITPEGTAGERCADLLGERRILGRIGHGWLMRAIVKRVSTQRSAFALQISTVIPAMTSARTRIWPSILQLEQNLKFDFSMTLEDGRQLEPLFGPGYTGLKNMGNSCYMASVLQSVFALKPFQQRYLTTADDHAITCANDAATCLHCQLSKLADGLHSGRYSIPAESADDTAPQAQDGIPPAMFKALVGKDHPEFSTMRQQDAYEFFQHLVRLVEQKERANKTNGGDPTTAFNFMLQQRLQCTKCRKVRYSKQITKDISVGVPARKKNKEEEAENTEEGKEKKEIEYEEVTFQECLDRFVADEIAPDYACPHCMDRTTAMK
ncbi:hypothetical protein BC938DRAFT_481615 [Jimgerdemannia flammicorona]|uniref:Uncharacterized protein n=1 Tax=Jimgerdemannia flammicorona TaxID=994334 RepID=A0A433QFR1_9FUNG|nr:hypothetical protein BC938DRAFT_481615 [Jimgerdemannia flammicorona]